MHPPEDITPAGTVGPIATLKDGRIFSCYIPGVGDSNFYELLAKEHHPEQWLYVRTSSDGGRTWTEPRRAFAFPAGRGLCYGGPPLVDSEGNIHIFSIRYYRVDFKGLEVPEMDSVLQHNTSKDGGETWAAVQQIDFGQRYTGSLNCALKMDNGRLLIPLSYYDYERKTGKFVSMTVYSDDGGETWGRSNGCPVDSGGEWIESGAIEPVVVQFLSGMVWMIIRTQTGYNWESFSNDGAIWTPPRSTRIVSSNSPSAVLRLTDGRIVLFWNNLYDEAHSSKASYARHILHGAISDDEGQTWGPPKVVVQRRPEDGAPHENVLSLHYPFLCQAPDGAVVLQYSRIRYYRALGKSEEGSGLMRVDPNWLAAR